MGPDPLNSSARMIGCYDIAYAIGLTLSAPVWLVRAKSRRKVLTALRERMGDVPTREGRGKAVMIHAVSLGEMNATRELVAKLRESRPDLEVIVSTTTATGWERGQALYEKTPGVTLIRYPLDWTTAIARVLDRMRPDLVVLMELEVWPNFVKQCAKRGICVIIINARLTTSSFRNYRLARPLARSMFRRVGLVCAQDEVYAKRFIDVGAPEARVRVTGTMKFDNAKIEERVEGADELASEVGLARGAKVWVCGSTGPGEEQIILEQYRKMDPKPRLVIVPRHPERFDEVAKLIQNNGFELTHRSENKKQPEKGTR